MQENKGLNLDAAKAKALAMSFCYMYSSGPEEKGVWERAGGNKSVLVAEGAPSARWVAAIEAMRHPDKGEVTVQSLVSVARHDYPFSPHLAGII